MASEGKSVRKSGECKWFNSKKGFGFITAVDGSEDVFVHQSAIHAEGFRSLAEKEPVEYETAIDDKGRVKALNVTGPAGAHVKGAPKPRPRFFNRRRDEATGTDGAHTEPAAAAAAAPPAAAAPAAAATSTAATPAASGAAGTGGKAGPKNPRPPKKAAAPAAAAASS